MINVEGARGMRDDMCGSFERTFLKIIRNRTTNETATRSSLNNRGVRSTPGCQPASASTLKGAPSRNDGALF